MKTVDTRQLSTAASGIAATSSRLLYLVCFILLVLSTANSSKAKRSHPIQASLAAQPSPSVAVAGAGTPIEGYTLSPLVIVTAIDGSLTALDRSTGETLWNLNSKVAEPYQDRIPSDALTDISRSAFTPLVSTEYGKRHSSLAAILATSVDNEEESRFGKASHRGDRDGFALDGLPSKTRHLLQAAGMYIVEPGSSGRLYLLTSRDDEEGGSQEEAEGQTYTPKARLQRVPLTLPELVNLSPFSFPGDKGRVFTGTKRTRLLRIDPLTGQLDRSWEADGSEVSGSSLHEDDTQNDECKWAYLARTDYTLSISLPRRPHLSQTLHYSTYSPQSSDGDVAASWFQMYSNARLRGGRSPGLAADDGQLIIPTGLDAEGRGRAKLSGWNSTRGFLDHAWTREMDSQVVDVFDLLLPRKIPASPSSHTHPVIVPHPPFALSEKSLADGSNDKADNVDATEEDTLLTFCPSTGSLYALSSRRFPGVVKDISPAPAGLEQTYRDSHALAPGQRSSSGRHHPLECKTFGCWLGRYKVDEEVFGGQEETRKLLGPGRGGYRLEGPSTPPPLGLPDGSSRPTADPPQRQSGSTETPLTLSRRVRSTIAMLTPSKKALVTQAVALLILVGFAMLFRRGSRIRDEIDRQRSAQIVQDAGLMWDPRIPATRAGESSSAAAPFLPADEVNNRTGGIPSADVTASPEDQVPESTSLQRSGTVVKRDPTEIANELIAEEEADNNHASTVKKRRRKRGKRSGAAVKAKANSGAGLNGDEESATEDEKENTVFKQGGESQQLHEQPQALTPSAKPDIPDVVLGEVQQALTLPPSAAAAAAAASLPGPTTSTSALEISDEVLGYGSSGTVVFKGKFQSRLVAVKRLLVDFVHLASQEISLLESADDHPNVIRYFYKEQKANFLFIALELCPASLADVVERPDEWKDLAVRLEPKKAVAQIASGLRHLHGLSIVHRDIKPQNILVAYKDPHQPATSSLKMLLSDFGLSKRLDSVAQSSFSQTMHHPGGTAGWRAPEILSGDVSLDEGGSSASTSTSSSLPGNSSLRSSAPRMRLTRGVDIFALGCVTYYLLTSGDHPFGARYEREVNILRNQKNLSRLGAFGEEGVEASHLIAAMIENEPTKRPRAVQVLAHPYFWDAGKRLAFLQDVSDRLEVIDRERDRALSQNLPSNLSLNASGSMNSSTTPGKEVVGGVGGGGGGVSLLPTSAESELLRQLEIGAKEVTAGGDWTKKVDKAFMDDLGKWRKYHGHSVRDLLRALRNKKHHYQDMPPALRRSMGHLPDGFLSYFTRRFPRLFLHVYEVVARDGFIKSETSFKDYFARPEEE